MTPDLTPPTSTAQSAKSAYTILCLMALMAMVLVLMETERELPWILLLAAVGAIGVMARWRAAPPLLLLGLAVLELSHRIVWSSYFHRVDWATTSFTNVALCAAFVAYSAGQYRLLSLKHAIFPIDTRRSPAAQARRSAPIDSRQRRSPHLIQSWEAPVLAITAAGWAVGVSLFWLVLSILPAPLDMRWRLWRGLLLIFTVGLTTALLGAAVAYLSWRAATPGEYLLFLQDQAWRETRREQNQINRWMTWARLRQLRRKEQT